MEFCKWAVVFFIDGSNYDDGKQRMSVTAVFRYPHQAEEFIEKCLPAENRHRFSVVNTDTFKEDDHAELHENRN